MRGLDLFLIYSCCLSGLYTIVGATEEENLLIKSLFSNNYNLTVRPAKTPREKVVVRIGMTLSSFMGLNMKAEEMATYVFMNMEWEDHRLMWNPAEHGDVNVIRVPSAKVWRPDIVLINNNDGVFDVALHVHVQVHSNGKVTWTPPALYRSSCGVKVTYFPFDWQNCSMVFHSYTYDSSEVELHHALDDDGREIREVIYDQSYSEGGEWIIRHQPSRKNVHRADNYEDITFYLIMERKPMYYVFNIIIPCILITIIAIFNFYLPPDAGEKMGLSINVLLTLTVFLLLLADKCGGAQPAPPLPNTHHMPLWVRRIFIHLLPPYLGLLRPKVEAPLSLSMEQHHHRKPTPMAVSRTVDEYFIRKPSTNIFFPKPNRYQPEGMCSDLRKFIEGPSQYLTLPPELKAAIQAVTYIAEQLQAAKDYEALKEDWQYVAMVVDRLFLWIFVVFTTVGTLAIFTDASFNTTPTEDGVFSETRSAPLRGGTPFERRTSAFVPPLRKRMMKTAGLLWTLWASLLLAPSGASETERLLLVKLLHGYDLKVRPARNWEERVTVRVGMTLSQLMGLNEKNEEMTTNVFMNLAWTDYRLSWTPEDFDNITVVRLPPKKVWRPDIYLINNNDGQFDVALYVNVLVYSDGTVKWLPPAIYRSSCSIEVAYFPFDWQNCSMVFRSYTYDSSEVDLQYALDDDGNELQEIIIDENAFTENGEWQICHKPSRKNVREDLYEDITFYLIIERKPLFYIINIIVPCILTSVLAIFVFYLPPGAGEKMTLSISVLIALTVFMLLLADRVPETSLGIPIIVNYVMFTMILVTFSVILSVVVLNLHHRTPSTHHMPLWVRKVFIHALPKYLGMQRPNPEKPLVEEPTEDTPMSRMDNRRPGTEYFIRKINPQLILPWRGRSDSTVQLQSFFDTESYCLILPPDLKSAIAAVTYMAEQLRKQDTDDTMTEDWQYIAIVVDRLFLWLFVVITTLGTLALFLDASFNYTPDQPFA
ncbi:hypothetical protein COCON_G00054050 [Conger conger]|uniref:Acetylcholine receptor subunit beta n=1 Tax=Conger conger TaxID=82655 RepID=A0A9Q1I5V2_CONCO|nr:hypothetical protein COCON_G00054050 [Conger conger]